MAARSHLRAMLSKRTARRRASRQSGATGRTKGNLNSKLHRASGGRRRQLRFFLSPGQRSTGKRVSVVPVELLRAKYLHGDIGNRAVVHRRSQDDGRPAPHGTEGSRLLHLAEPRLFEAGSAAMVGRRAWRCYKSTSLRNRQDCAAFQSKNEQEPTAGDRDAAIRPHSLHRTHVVDPLGLPVCALRRGAQSVLLGRASGRPASTDIVSWKGCRLVAIAAQSGETVRPGTSISSTSAALTRPV